MIFNSNLKFKNNIIKKLKTKIFIKSDFQNWIHLNYYEFINLFFVIYKKNTNRYLYLIYMK